LTKINNNMIVNTIKQILEREETLKDLCQIVSKQWVEQSKSGMLVGPRL